MGHRRLLGIYIKYIPRLLVFITDTRDELAPMHLPQGGKKTLRGEQPVLILRITLRAAAGDKGFELRGRGAVGLDHVKCIESNATPRAEATRQPLAALSIGYRGENAAA